jgi:hypothetical protein
MLEGVKWLCDLWFELKYASTEYLNSLANGLTAHSSVNAACLGLKIPTTAFKIPRSLAPTITKPSRQSHN